MSAEHDMPVGETGQETRNELPETGDYVWVRCNNFRTLAFRDEHGVWRSVAKGEELKGKVEVIETTQVEEED